MKLFSSILTLFFICSCSLHKNNRVSNPLYEILTQQNQGGARIRFYEIVSEPNEVRMFQNDIYLKKRFKSKDINSCNFIVLNMGEQTVPGYLITIDSILETTDKIIIRTKDIDPKLGSKNSKEICYPYTIVKINSKKQIEIK